jgi:hypothetical protein
MPSRIYSHFPERKITQPDPPANPKPGTVPSVTVKKVKIYPSSKGLR